MTQVPSNSTPFSNSIRTILASLFGAIALWLILASLIVVWLNRTLINTPTFVSTVAPVVQQPAVQAYIAQTATAQLLQSAPTQILADEILTPTQAATNDSDWQNALMQPVVYASLMQLVESSDFESLWTLTMMTAQRNMIRQLDANTGELTLNLNPLMVGAIDQLKQTRLGVITSKITVSSNIANFEFNGGVIGQVKTDYRVLKEGTGIIVLLALLTAVLSVVISVDHAKTVRRILAGTGSSCLVLAGFLSVTSIIKLPQGNEIQRAAALAIAGTLFHNLQLAALILGLICIAGAIGSKVCSSYRVR